MPLAVAFVAVLSATAAAEGRPVASSHSTASVRAKAVPAKCVISKIAADETGKVNAAGRCSLRGKTVLPYWSYSYVSYDSTGAACGAAEQGHQSSFALGPPGFSRATVKVTLRARHGRTNVAPRSFNLNPGGADATCGKMDNLPAPQVLCPWTAPQPIQRCGEPLADVAWSTPATMQGNVISAGHIVSGSGACWYSDSDGSGFIDPPINMPMSFDWLGYHDQGKNVFCKDHLVVRGGVSFVQMVNPAGQQCAGHPPRSNSAWSFQVPPAWGGQLYVFFTMSASHADVSSGGGLGNTSQTAVFTLPGSENGCPQLQPGWRP